MAFGLNDKKDGGIKDVFGASPNMALQYNRGGVFSPLDVASNRLYVNRNNATVSSWLDQSTNAFNFEQAVGTKQPDVTAISVNFDGNDDIMEEVVANAFSGDSSGILFFSGYFDSSMVNRYFSSGDIGTANNIVFGLRATGEIYVQTVSPTNDSFTSTNQVSNGAYFYCYIKSTGTAWEFNLNGVSETPKVLVGSNSGNWFADVPLRDNLTFGATHQLSTLFGVANIAGAALYNTIPNAGEIANLQAFFADPTNFQA